MPTPDKPYQTAQEEFWAGSFGDQYIDRNAGEDLVAANTSLFARILTHAHSVRSVIEFGANIGLNLIALKHLLPHLTDLAAIEINQKAIAELSKLPGLRVYPMSLLEFEPDKTRDLAFCKGVLIHIKPDRLASVYDKLYCSSHRYICLAEYYNPTPVEVSYRGNEGFLFKRDFAGDMMDRYPDLRLVDYGFVYHRDPLFPQDDFTWFLLEKGR